MGLVRRTKQAELDYRAIYRYIARDNAAAAERTLLRFDAKLEMLADMTGAGAARPEFGRGVRSLPVGRYLLIYRPVEVGIELLRVIHGARNVRRVFRRGVP